ncbi:MAG: hypothetical protein Q9195_003490 [Heterodermia aff. obscurata]
MVKLEEVKDAELNAPQPGPLTSEDFEDDADFTDTDSSLSSPPPSPSLPPLQESLSDRIYALRDMLPPSTRRRISSSLVLNELPAAEVVVIATPELTQAALEKLDADKDYTHILLSNQTRLQVSSYLVQQMPRVKILQNAALLRSERALLVWGHTFQEVTDKLTSMEKQLADTMTTAKLARSGAAKTPVAARTRGVNYSTPVCTYLALSGCTVIVMLEVMLANANSHDMALLSMTPPKLLYNTPRGTRFSVLVFSSLMLTGCGLIAA